ncbi:hypothetical protein ES702_07796 [subsurface metagenome]
MYSIFIFQLLKKQSASKNLSIKKAKMGKPRSKSLEKIEFVKQAYEIEGRLTVRRCWYIWLTHKLITIKGKTRKQRDNLYKKQSEYLTDWREKGYLSPEIIIDHSRQLIESQTYHDFDEAFENCCEYFSLNSMDYQDKYIEAWIEKEGDQGKFRKICLTYDVPLQISKGFASYSCKHEAMKRFEKIDKPIVILYCGDFDAEGLYIPETTERFLKEHSLSLAGNLIFKRVFMTEKDFYDLEKFHVEFTPNKKALENPQVRRYVEKYGKVKLETDAIAGDVQKARFKEALFEEIDQDLVNSLYEQADEEKEAWLEKHYKK